MKYSVQLKVYEGPLDLLYDLIAKHKIDIKDISIIEITKQYLAYLDMLEEFDLEIASEFIIMASKLLQIKSKYLLYKQRNDEEEEDPRLELMEKLVEYKKFKNATEDLKTNVTYIEDVFYRKKEEIVVEENLDLETISLDSIVKILPHILKVKKDELEEVKDEKLNKIVRTRIISVEEKMHYVRDIMKEKENIRFTNLIDTYEKDEIIATFLSVLELIKTNEIMVVQDLFFEDILIKRNMES
ncbi:MAG: segregation/condensation protein A [Paraclostridium bifermentans]|jgi:segregation and condensation protein A|uniref:Segregation and condensation protein A n=1 Tax=Paraclostridium bifermentans ATCC 638 = DSM 14991 TaxID=1233171 RepID=T4VE64_PARBF|nr:segregation/condensation protein A [Paraclostridium bifermentans]RDC49736.1 segregation and condensation protein A [Acinetobacter sp. RIT592]EQK42019.1 scpA/B family protein [[Clostridium] bifermentans ATCC 638] [Paraclostridium bifermentans ATCC 638 = DSM 14991]MBS6506784.1 segregation/condensation protein A [Paraclostridium bifermentans]RIZ59330.1 segregation and condensation protein A [Paraclostridium bifermentans]UAG18888.1 segregation/condensation protein A [Paraclostridium bifermentan